VCPLRLPKPASRSSRALPTLLITTMAEPAVVKAQAKAQALAEAAAEVEAFVRQPKQQRRCREIIRER
jgi:hypothetical protein